MTIFGWAAQWHGNVIFSIRCNGNNPASAQSTTQRFAVIAFIQPQSLGFPFAFSDTDAIEGGQDGALVVPISFGHGKVERMPMRFDEKVAFEPANTVFAGVADLRGGPFFDLMTLAS